MLSKQYAGLTIAIENPKGSQRSGTAKDGSRWVTTLQDDYGFLKGVKGRDKDGLDVFLNPEASNAPVYIIDQLDPLTGAFDEHKVMLGYPSKAEAVHAYLRNYDPAWCGLGNVTGMTTEHFKTLIASGSLMMPVAKAYKIKGGPGSGPQAGDAGADKERELINERTRIIGDWAQRTGVTGADIQASIYRGLKNGKTLDEAVKQTFDRRDNQRRNVLGPELFNQMVSEGKITRPDKNKSKGNTMPQKKTIAKTDDVLAYLQSTAQACLALLDQYVKKKKMNKGGPGSGPQAGGGGGEKIANPTDPSKAFSAGEKVEYGDTGGKIHEGTFEGWKPNGDAIIRLSSSNTMSTPSHNVIGGRSPRNKMDKGDPGSGPQAGGGDDDVIGPPSARGETWSGVPRGGAQPGTRGGSGGGAQVVRTAESIKSADTAIKELERASGTADDPKNMNTAVGRAAIGKATKAINAARKEIKLAIKNPATPPKMAAKLRATDAEYENHLSYMP